MGKVLSLSQFFAINNINRQNASKGRPQRDQGDVSLRQGLCAIPHEHELPERCSNCYEANTRSRKESRTDCLHLATLEPLEAKSVHRPPLLPRSVRWVCRQRRLEKISQKQLETGKDSVSPSSSPSKTVKPPFPSSPLPRLSSSRP